MLVESFLNVKRSLGAEIHEASRETESSYFLSKPTKTASGRLTAALIQPMRLSSCILD